MINQEFSNEFDVLYNNITSNQAPGLDDYEKSVFLTRAQDDVLKSYANPITNKTQQGYDGSEIRQIDFSMVTVIEKYESFSPANFDYRPNSVSVELVPNILMPINEQVTVDRGGKEKWLQVIPISYIEYRRLMSMPFKRPLKSQAWRILNAAGNSGTADIIVGPDDTIIEYSMRYVKKPRPIILTELEDGLTINNEPGPLTCELDPILHPEILQRAVELAKAAYIGDLQSTLALGQASQTNVGMLTQSR